MKPKASVFDMDGVLIASAASKSEAFYRTALPYGQDAARKLVEFHEHAGSVSRRARFDYFFSDILHRPANPGEIEDLMHYCAERVLDGALAAPKVSGVVEFLAGLDGKRFVVSGVDEKELRLILDAHGLTPYFDRIWGGEKAALLKRLVADGDIPLPAVYYGDEYADLLAARGAGLSFVYVASASQWREGRIYCSERNVPYIEDFQQRQEAVA